MALIGNLVVNLVAKTGLFGQNMKKAQRDIKAFGESAAAMGRAVSSATKFVAHNFNRFVIQPAKWAAVALIGAGIASIKMAADAETAAARFGALMGDMRDEAEKFTDTMVKAFRLDDDEVRNLSGSLFEMLTNLGIADKKALSMSQQLTKLSFGMAALYRTKPEQAMEAIKGALSGQVEAMRKFGITFSKPQTKRVGMPTGGSVGAREVESPLDEIDAVVSRFDELIAKTANAQQAAGWYSKTTAGAFAYMKNTVSDLAEAVGGTMLNSVTDLFITIGDYIKYYTPAITGFVDKWVQKVVALVDAHGGVNGIMDLIVKAIGKFASYFEDHIVPAINNIVAALPKIANDLSTIADKFATIGVVHNKIYGRGGFAQNLGENAYNDATSAKGILQNIAAGPFMPMLTVLKSIDDTLKRPNKQGSM